MTVAEAATTAAVLPHDAFGKTLALLNAVVWSIALVFFKKSGDSVPPLALNLFKNTVGLLLLFLTLIGLPIVNPQWSPDVPWHALDPTRSELWILLISGILGIAVADTVFFFGLNRAGVGLIAIVDCMYTPFVMFFAAVLLHEQLTLIHFVGAALIVTAVLVSSGHAPPEGRSRGQILLGVGAGLLALAIMAFGIVWATPVLNTTPVLWAATIRFFGGTVLLALFGAWFPGVRVLRETFTPSATWRVTIPGSVFGAYFAMIFWIGGFTYTTAAVAGMLNQSSSVFALILATVVLRERLTKRKITSLIIATVGVLIVIFHADISARFATIAAAALRLCVALGVT